MPTIISAFDLGSQTAKNGFQNEKEVADKFNNWRFDGDAQQWLMVMNYDLKDIEHVEAVVLSGYKTDVQVQVTIYLKDAIDVRNLQVKLVSNMKGFNQIDKRWIEKYVELWNIPNEIISILRRYTGELPPTITNPKDRRRMFANEFKESEQKLILDWLQNNKFMIVSDILKGRGEFAAEWILVAQKIANNARWILENLPFEAVSMDEYLPEELRCDTSSKGYIQLIPGVHKCDGFFISKFRKKTCCPPKRYRLSRCA